MNVFSKILNPFGRHNAAPPAAPGPGVRVRTLPGGSPGNTAANPEPNNATPIRITTIPPQGAGTDPAKPEAIPEGKGIERFASMMDARRDRDGIWGCTQHVPVTPEIWAIILNRPGVAPTKREIASLQEIHARSADIDRRIMEHSASMAGSKMQQLEAALRDQVRAGQATTPLPGKEALLESMARTRRALKAMEAEISKDTFSVIGPICQRVAEAAADLALGLFEQEQRQGAAWGFQYRTTPQFLSLLYVFFSAAMAPVKYHVWGVGCLKPDRVLFGRELWPLSAEENATAKAEVERKLREQQEREGLRERQKRLDLQASEMFETERRETLSRVNALNDEARETSARKAKEKSSEY